MIGSILWKFRLFARRLWVRAVLISLLAIVAALLAPLSDLLPFSIKTQIDEAKLQSLLDILTSSMLAVTTFSLSIMVTAHLAADSSATPRAHRLLQQDSRTQTVLATFLGAFVYALTLTILLSTGLFADDEMALIYLFTVGVIGLVVVAILRWVGHLDGLGSVEATIRRAEERAKAAVAIRAEAPFLGAHALTGRVTIPPEAHVLTATSAIFVNRIDTRTLSHKAGKWGGTVYLRVSPGDWVLPGDPLAMVSVSDWSEARATELRACFATDETREHGQDTAYSFVVLAEIAERALSPGINDPRTGTDVVGRLTRLFLSLPAEVEPDEVAAPNVYAPGLDPVEIVRNSLDAIARDGQGFQEVLMAVQGAARALSRHPDPGMAAAARALSGRVLAYARSGILLVEDLERIGAAGAASGPAPRAEDVSEDGIATALGETTARSRYAARP